MKRIILGLIVSTMLLASCKKDDTTSNNNNRGNNNGIDYTTDIVSNGISEAYKHYDSSTYCTPPNDPCYTIYATKTNDVAIGIDIQLAPYSDIYLNSKNMTSKTSFELNGWDEDNICNYYIDPGCSSSFFRYSGYGTLSGNTIAIHIDKSSYSDVNKTHLISTVPYSDYSGTR